ncbi:MAG: Zn-ribbon domain-containing OB-fold protein [Lautropia sp.]
MPYLPALAWAPSPDDDDAPFWERCNQRRLCFQRCDDCRFVVHPPLSVCPACQSTNRGWLEAPREAFVFAFTWIHTAADAAVEACTPYNVVLVAFEGLPDVKLISNVVDVQHGGLKTGDRLALVWEPGSEGQLLPRFRLA